MFFCFMAGEAAWAAVSRNFYCSAVSTFWGKG